MDELINSMKILVLLEIAGMLIAPFIVLTLQIIFLFKGKKLEKQIDQIERDTITNRSQ